MDYIGYHSRVLPTRCGTAATSVCLRADYLYPDATSGPDYPLPVRCNPGGRDAAPVTPPPHRSRSARHRAPGGLAGNIAYSGHFGAC